MLFLTKQGYNYVFFFFFCYFYLAKLLENMLVRLYPTFISSSNNHNSGAKNRPGENSIKYLNSGTTEFGSYAFEYSAGTFSTPL